jgi:hypothetical protein
MIKTKIHWKQTLFDPQVLKTDGILKVCIELKVKFILLFFFFLSPQNNPYFGIFCQKDVASFLSASLEGDVQ